MTMISKEINPGRSFDARNDAYNIQKALQLGATEQEISHWIEAQLGTLLVEHGPIENQRQPIFYYDVIDKGDAQEPEIYFGDGRHFGDQHISFKNMEKEYPEVAQGWSNLARLFVDKTAQSGDGIVWVSPMKFYLKPRLNGDQPSTYDVLNFYKIISKNDNHTHILGQTIKLDGALTDPQYATLLAWHGSQYREDGLTPEQVVTLPTRFQLGTMTLKQHYDWLNELSLSDSIFGYALTGVSDEHTKDQIYQMLQKYIPTFRTLLLNHDTEGVQRLIWNLVWKIKDKDAIRLGRDPYIERQRYLEMQDMMTHRLMGALPQDSFSTYGFNGLLEAKGNCRLHGSYQGDTCPKCKKHTQPC